MITYHNISVYEQVNGTLVEKESFNFNSRENAKLCYRMIISTFLKKHKLNWSINGNIANFGNFVIKCTNDLPIVFHVSTLDEEIVKTSFDYEKIIKLTNEFNLVEPLFKVTQHPSEFED